MPTAHEQKKKLPLRASGVKDLLRELSLLPLETQYHVLRQLHEGCALTGPEADSVNRQIDLKLSYATPPGSAGRLEEAITETKRLVRHNGQVSGRAVRKLMSELLTQALGELWATDRPQERKSP